jgi:hypothetical protein
VGEISSVGASSSVCLVGVASPSILSSYEWVHKDLLAGLKIGDLGFSTLAVCELVKGRTAVFGSMGPFEVGDSPQTVPVEVSGSRAVLVRPKCHRRKWLRRSVRLLGVWALLKQAILLRQC